MSQLIEFCGSEQGVGTGDPAVLNSQDKGWFRLLLSFRMLCLQMAPVLSTRMVAQACKAGKGKLRVSEEW